MNEIAGQLNCYLVIVLCNELLTKLETLYLPVKSDKVHGNSSVGQVL